MLLIRLRRCLLYSLCKVQWPKFGGEQWKALAQNIFRWGWAQKNNLPSDMPTVEMFKSFKIKKGCNR